MRQPSDHHQLGFPSHLKCMSHFYSFFLFCWRFVPLSRWVPLRRTTASSWTSLVPVVLPPCRAAWTPQPWERAWRLPLWAAHRWAWANPGRLEWVPSTMGRGCRSKPMPAHAPSLCPCRVWRDRTQERWVPVGSGLFFSATLVRCSIKLLRWFFWKTWRQLIEKVPGVNGR